MKRSSSAAAPRRPIILSSASTDCSQRIGVLTSLFIYIFLHGDKLKSHQWYQFVIQRQPNITDRWQENHWKTALHIALAEPGIDDLLRWIWIWRKGIDDWESSPSLDLASLSPQMGGRKGGGPDGCVGDSVLLVILDQTKVVDGATQDYSVKNSFSKENFSLFPKSLTFRHFGTSTLAEGNFQLKQPFKRSIILMQNLYFGIPEIQFEILNFESCCWQRIKTPFQLSLKDT